MSKESKREAARVLGNCDVCGCSDCRALRQQMAHLKRRLEGADEHSLVMEESGVDGIDRCHRVINKQAAKLRAMEEKRRLHRILEAKLRQYFKGNAQRQDVVVILDALTAAEAKGGDDAND